MRTLIPVPLVSAIKRFDCILSVTLISQKSYFFVDVNAKINGSFLLTKTLLQTASIEMDCNFTKLANRFKFPAMYFGKIAKK